MGIRFNQATSRKIRYSLLGALAVLSAGKFAVADSLIWTGTDGTNPLLWDHTAALNWNDVTTSTNPSLWLNSFASPNAATFNLVTPATVSLGNDNIVVGAVTFSTAGWTIGTTGTGVMAFGPTGSMNITNAGTNTISAIIADGSSFDAINGGVTGIIKNGAGNLILTNTNTYTGPTSILAGTLTVLGTGSIAGSSNVDVLQGSGFTINNTSGTAPITRAGAITLHSTGLSILGNGGSTNTADLAGALNIGAGLGTTTITPNASFTSTMTFASLGTRAPAGLINFTAPNLGKPAGANVGQYFFTAPPTLVGGAVGTPSAGIIPYALATDSVSGLVNFATYDVNGIRPLTSGVDNTATAATGVNWEVNSFGSTAGPITLNSMAIITASSVINLTGAATITSGGVLIQGGAGNSAITGGTIEFGGNEGIFQIVNAATSATITSIIDGTAGITKSGAGTLTPNAANTYTGTTAILQGRLVINADNNLGVPPPLPTPGSILVNGGVFATNSSFTLNANRGMSIGPSNGQGNGNFNIASATAVTYAGIIANNGNGIGNMNQSGNGSFVVTGPNTYSGNTLLSAGFYVVNADSAFGAVPSSFVANSIQIDGSGIMANTGTVTLNANRGIQITGATGSNGQITARANAVMIVNGVISEQNPGNFPQLGTGNGNIAGTVIFNGANTFTGGIQWSAGNPTTLQFSSEPASGGAPLGMVPSVVVPNYIRLNQGVFQLGGGNVTLNVNRGIVLGSPNTSSNSGAIDAVANSVLTIPGVIGDNGTGAAVDSLIRGIMNANFPGQMGTVILGGANTYNGSTTVTSGTLSVSADNNLGTGTTQKVILNNNAAAGITATLQFSSSMTLTSTRPVQVGPNTTSPGSGQIEVLSGMTVTYGGTISSNSASDNFTKIGTGTLLLTGTASAFTGGTTSGAGSLQLAGPATLGSSPLTILQAADVTFNSNTTGTTTRAGAVTIGGGSLTILGTSGSVNTADAAGALNLAPGLSTTSITPAATNSSTMTFASMGTRAPAAILNYSAPNIGMAAGANVGQYLFTAAPTPGSGLIGGTVGTPSAGIIPWSLATDTVSGLTNFATYDVNGIRPLTSGVDNTSTAATGVNWEVNGSGSTSGTLSLNSLSILTAGTFVTLSGTATITSGGVLVQGGAGNSNILGGTLDFGSTEGIIHTVGTGTSVIISSQVTGSAGLTKSGLGNVSLNNTSNSYSGTTTILQGSLTVNADAQLGAVPGAPMANSIVVNGGTLQLNSTSIILNANRGITLGAADSTGGSGTINSANGTKSTIAGVISNNGTGPGNLVYGVGINGFTGNGTLVLTGINTYSGFTNLLAGHTVINTASALGTGTGPQSIRINGAALDSALVAPAVTNTVDLPANKGISIGGGPPGGNGQLNADAGSDLEIDGVISEAAPGQILKIGTKGTASGTVTLNGANTFTGQMQAGQSSGNIFIVFTYDTTTNGAGASLGPYPATLNPAALNINGGRLIYDGTLQGQTATTIGVNRGIALGTANTGASNGNIDVANNQILTINSVINKAGTLPTGSGRAALLKGGQIITNGTLILNGANTYDGDTTIGGTGTNFGSGTLEISADSALGNGFETFLNLSGGTLKLDSSFTIGAQRTIRLSIGNAIDTGANNVVSPNGILNNGTNTSGSLTKLGSGTLTIGGPSNYFGTTTVSAGTLNFTGNGSISSSVATVNGAGTLLATPQGGFFGRGASGTTTVAAGGTYDLAGNSIADSITLSGGKLTNSGSASTLSTATVKGVGFAFTSSTTNAFSGDTAVSYSGGGGSGAVAVAELGLATGTYTLSSGGSGFTSTPTVSFTGGGGTGATAVVSMAGTGPAALTGLTIVNPGYGYTSAPTIVLTGGGGGGATWTSNNSNFQLIGISTTNAGSGYTSAATAAIAGTTIPAGVAATTPLMASFTLSGTSNTIGGAGNIIINGPITGTGGGFTKVDGNAIVLNGTSTYDQPTIVSGGTLGGAGTLVSSIVAGTGAHTIYPSATLASGSATTLTVGGLTTNANTTLQFNLVTPNSPGGSDLINVTGSNGLNVSGGTLSLVDNFAGEGYYKILQYSGAIGGTGLSSLTIPSVVTNTGPAGKEAYILDTHHDAGFVDVHKVLIGDANGDGTVDGADFDVWFTHLLANTFDYGSGDFNGDGHVDGADFDIWFTHLLNTFGGTDTSFGGFTDTQLSELSEFLTPAQMADLPSGVPEPASLALLGMGAVGLLARRRRR